jgi:predicted RNA-binding protein with TRAM domain
MANYIWQLGIDWNAIETEGMDWNVNEPAEVSYLRGGLVGQDDKALPGTSPVQSGDTIIFQIFDVSSSGGGLQVAGIDSFFIRTQAAVKGQEFANPLSNQRPAIAPVDESTPQISLFGPAYCSWISQEVAVEPLPEGVTVGRFLLTVQVRAREADGVVRLFSHDPEMVVGPNG